MLKRLLIFVIVIVFMFCFTACEDSKQKYDRLISKFEKDGSLSSEEIHDLTNAYNMLNDATITPPPILNTKLEILDDWTWENNGEFTTIRGKLKNTGGTNINYYKVVANYEDYQGNILDTGYVYSNKTIKPESQVTFQIFHQYDSEISKVSVNLENYY
jgi:hypothetical protein